MKVENDLISRSALIAYVKELPTYDATDIGFIFKRYPSGLFAPDDIVKSIQYAPDVDAVEVVRCKDCVCKQKPETFGDLHCALLDIPMKNDDFCSYGEREEGADND